MLLGKINRISTSKPSGELSLKAACLEERDVSEIGKMPRGKPMINFLRGQ